MKAEREFEGFVENGVVRLEGDDAPPDGTRVSVRVLAGKTSKKRKTPKTRPASRRRKSCASPELQRLAGIIKDAPSDASYNLDHYLYGTPKKKRR
ncbi:MAG: hypothetical protein HZB38_12370 [Planctomycetes bacterium]|nr:hypothetical protein [Planctomycetota bacterium]